ncbi:hypothetical protein P4C99_17515 [Pontiellaceae bacterium B1224]|nr:hypothetical protein [Pontiellaceae bacterium B1224]
MTYPRVNLLEKDEQRYQGIVSRGFILLCGVGIPTLLILLTGILIFSYNSNIKSDIEANQVFWDSLEPRLKSHAQGTKGLATNQKVLDLFTGWETSQASFYKLLDEVQDAVPELVQFTRLSVRTGDSQSIYKTPAELQLDYSLIIEGVAEGGQAENEVISLQKDLLACEQIGNTFETLKLDSMKKRSASEGESVREFRLVGEAGKGEMK